MGLFDLSGRVAVVSALCRGWVERQRWLLRRRVRMLC